MMGSKNNRRNISFAVEAELNRLMEMGSNTDEEILLNIARCKVQKRRADERRNKRLLREQPFNQIRML